MIQLRFRLVEWRRVKYSGDKALIEIATAGARLANHHALNKPQPGAMSLSADALYKMSDVELLAAYIEARRQFVEKRFTRDTHRARLAWIKAKMFIGSSGGVTERNMAIDVSEEIARKGSRIARDDARPRSAQGRRRHHRDRHSIPRRIGADRRARRRRD